MRIEKSNKCDICDNSFARNKILQNHIEYILRSFWSENKFFIASLPQDPLNLLVVVLVVDCTVKNSLYLIGLNHRLDKSG